MCMCVMCVRLYVDARLNVCVWMRVHACPMRRPRMGCMRLVRAMREEEGYVSGCI